MTAQPPTAPAPAVGPPSPALYVREASLRFGMPMPTRPVSCEPVLAESRQQLLEQAAESLREVTDPWDYPSGTKPAVDLAAVAETLADVVLVAYGTAAAYGIGLDPVLAEVHRANLSQRRADVHGHVRQGSGYSAPHVAAVLAGQHDGSDPSDRQWWTEQLVDAAASVDARLEPELADRWLDAPLAQLGQRAPWEAIVDGWGGLVWRHVDVSCAQSDARVA